MKQETRPIAASVLGLIAGAGSLYWAALETWVVWTASTKSDKVRSLLGGSTKVTPALLNELRSWFTALTVLEALAVLFAVLLLLIPRRHLLFGGLVLVLAVAGLGLLDAFPFGIGKTELLAGLVVFPVLGIIGGIASFLFRSDAEFARSYGFD
jgi:hypothetical protein